MRTTAAICLFALASALCASACGEEAIDLGARSSTSDASTTDGALDDAGSGCTKGQPAVCAPDGATCTSASACCSQRCEGGFCVTSGTCTAPGTACTTRSTCCSGRCEPTGGDRICLGYCAADGAHCDGSQDCCSLACHANVCGGVICSVFGGSCAKNEECCSRSCDNGFCAVDSSTTCRASGEGCPTDAGASCCSGVCNQATARCDLGPGACRQPGTPCMVDGDCCRGLCKAGANGVPVCTSQCLADGAGCNSAGDCCGSVCTGAPARCGAPTCTDP